MHDSPPTPTPIAETDFAKKSGLSLDYVRELRGSVLTSEDWQKKSGGRVLLLPSGIAKLLAAAGAPQQAAEEVAQPVPALALPGPQTLTIARLCGNPGLVKATRETGELVTVRVRRDYRWRVGQEIRAYQPQIGNAHWRLAAIPKRTPRA